MEQKHRPFPRDNKMKRLILNGTLLTLLFTIVTTVAVNADRPGQSADNLPACINDPNEPEPESAFFGEDPNEPEAESVLLLNEDPNEPECVFIGDDPNEPEPESGLIVDLISCLDEDPNEPESILLLRNW
jgi:hypothetical protein